MMLRINVKPFLRTAAVMRTSKIVFNHAVEQKNQIRDVKNRDSCSSKEGSCPTLGFKNIFLGTFWQVLLSKQVEEQNN